MSFLLKSFSQWASKWSSSSQVHVPLRFTFLNLHLHTHPCSVRLQSLLWFTHLTFSGYKVPGDKISLTFFAFPQYLASHIWHMCCWNEIPFLICVFQPMFTNTEPWINQGRFIKEEKNWIVGYVLKHKLQIFTIALSLLWNLCQLRILANVDLVEFSGMPIFLKTHMKILQWKQRSLSWSQ